MEFEIGDIVKVRRGWNSIYENANGKIIGKTEANSFHILFEKSYLAANFFFSSNLFLVSKGNKPKLKTGDIVKILDKNSIYIDKIGKVGVIIENSGSTIVDVSFPSGSSRYFAFQLELMELAAQLENAEIDEMKELKEKYKEAYKQYEETKEIEKDIREKNKQNLIKQGDLRDLLVELERNILEEAKK